MKAKAKKIIAVIAAVALLALAAAFAVAWLIRPENLTPFIEHRLQKQLNTGVTIERASIGLVEGEIELTLRNMNAGTPGGLYVKTERLVLRISPWHMLPGSFEISSFSVAGSDAQIPFELLTGKGGLQEFTFPYFDVERTTLRLIGKKSKLNFENIFGFFKEGGLNVTMEALGGNAWMTAAHRGAAWEGKAQLSRLDLRDVNPDMAGSAEIAASFSVGGEKNYLTVQARGSGIVLPWYNKEMADVRFAVTAGGAGDTFTIDSFALTSPVLALAGKGLLSDIDSLETIGDAAIALDCTSQPFDYEELIRALPTQAMPDWLSLLLRQQIRGGQGRFASLGYHGRVRDFAAGSTYYMNVSGALELTDMNFGSGFSRERVRSVSGTGTYAKGVLEFKNLHGYTGGSELRSITLLFDRVEAPGMYLSISADFDMALADFLETWKAVMIDEEAAGAFSVISSVQSGRITGGFKSYTVDPSDEPTDVAGNIALSGCSFALGDKPVKDVSGTLSKKSFSTPLRVELAGTLDAVKVARLALSFEDIFRDTIYTYEAEMDDFPFRESFSLGDGASLVIRGKGKGTSVEGDVVLETPGFEIFGTPYRPDKGSIIARGRVKGSLWPDIDIAVPELDIRIPSGDVRLASAITDRKGRSRISGTVNLAHLQAYTKEGFRNLDGAIRGDITVAWDEDASFAGTVECDNALLFHEGAAVTVNGAIGVNEKIITTDELHVRYGDTPAVLSGKLTTGKTPAFEGNVTVDGYRMERGASDTVDLPDTLYARAALTFTNFKLYGIDVPVATATAMLANRTLHLDDIALAIPAGTMTGYVFVKDGEAPAFDIELSVKKGQTRTYLPLLTPGKSSLKGTLSIEGHLWGTANSVNGNIAFSSKDGRIMKYSTLSRIFSVLNVYKIIKTGELDLKSGFPYNRMSSHFTVCEGTISFEDFHVDSNSLQLSATGAYSLTDGSIDAILVVQPLEALDKTISAIPLVGWIITGKEGRLVLVSMKMTGPFDDPKVEPLPLESIKPAGEIIFRTLNLPVDMINSIGEMMKKDRRKEQEKEQQKQ